MRNITPFNKQNPGQWKQQNDETLQKVHDEALKAIISGVLNLHELEHTGAWRKAGRRLDYSKSTFEVYLQHHTTWSLKDFRFLEEAVFGHFDELKRNGLGSVLRRLKRLKKEPNPLAQRRKKRT
jgi:transposase InsO family protein